MAQFKMTHTKEEVVAGIKRRAILLRRLGVIGSTGHLATARSSYNPSKKKEERMPSLKALEAFSEVDE